MKKADECRLPLPVLVLRGRTAGSSTEVGDSYIVKLSSHCHAQCSLVSSVVSSARYYSILALSMSPGGKRRNVGDLESSHLCRRNSIFCR